MDSLVPGVPEYFFDDTWVAAQRRLVRRWLGAKLYPYPADLPLRSRLAARIAALLSPAARLMHECL